MVADDGMMMVQLLSQEKVTLVVLLITFHIANCCKNQTLFDRELWTSFVGVL